MVSTVARTTAFIYIRVSTPSQEVDEQIRIIQQYAADNTIEIIGRYGDYQKRHKSHQRYSFQSMLNDIESQKPNLIVVQKPDRFGTADGNELGYFLTILKRSGVRLVTAIDGKDHSKDDLETIIVNAVAASQSRQEQIDKAERVLFGKRRRAVLGEYVGSKYLVYGFDVVCISKEAKEKWRMVEDAWGLRIKYVLNDKGEYVEVERYGNEIVKDANGIMPDKEIRHRPSKDTSDRLFYSPSIRQERVDTLRRICEMFDNGWNSYGIAQELNQDGIKPVYSDRWYSAFIDGLLENTVLIGKPAWNRTTQAHFRHFDAGGRIVETTEDAKGVWSQNDKERWFQPNEEVFKPFIDPELFDRLQKKLDERRASTPMRSPRSETLWLGGLWWDEESQQNLAGNSQGKHFKVPGHDHKRLTFKEAEWFIGEYLKRIGHRCDTLGEAVESKKLLERLANEESMKELRFDYIVLEIESYLESKLKEGVNQVGGVQVIVDVDKEHGTVITTDGNYLELYCQMVKDDIEQNQASVQQKLDERKRLTFELIAMKNKDQFIIESYSQQISKVSREIESATAAPDFMSWWQQVQDEIVLLQQRQALVKKSIEKGTYKQKAEAIRKMIDRVVCHWESVPTTDGRYKNGRKTICQAVTIKSKVSAKDADGKQIEMMTIETPSAWS